VSPISAHHKLWDQLIEAPLYFCFWERSHSLIHHIPILVKIDRGNAADPMLGSGAGRVVDVHPGKFDSSCVGMRQFIQNRVEFLAVPSPGSCKINQHGAWELGDLYLEVLVSDVDGGVRVKAGQRKINLTFCANRLTVPAVLRDPVLGRALGTPYYNRLVVHMCPSSSVKN
jgi:hypothetical protein